MAENNSGYRERIADRLLEEKLDAMGVVLIEGPKACGKTTTAEQQAKSILYMDDPETMTQNLQLAETNIKRLLHVDIHTADIPFVLYRLGEVFGHAELQLGFPIDDKGVGKI